MEGGLFQTFSVSSHKLNAHDIKKIADTCISVAYGLENVGDCLREVNCLLEKRKPECFSAFLDDCYVRGLHEIPLNEVEYWLQQATGLLIEHKILDGQLEVTEPLFGLWFAQLQLVAPVDMWNLAEALLYKLQLPLTFKGVLLAFSALAYRFDLHFPALQHQSECSHYPLSQCWPLRLLETKSWKGLNSEEARIRIMRSFNKFTMFSEEELFKPILAAID